MEKGIRNFLEKHAEAGPVSFHMPGHKGRNLYRQLDMPGLPDNLYSWDITEIPGADNLFQAESVIAETMKKYETLYGCRKSYLLVNGSSGGIISAILSCVPKGGKLAMARNCHKSVFNGLILGDITPIYIYPETVDEYGIQGIITPKSVKEAFDKHPDIAALILTSPNYYGICSDIKEIAETVHQYNKILIVDQAHGAHLKFFENDMPKAAEDLGADIVINSTHKTLASFTQTAVLNVCSSRVDLQSIEDKLQMMESSSPSYPLMVTLDINADLILRRGAELMRQWKENIDWFYDEAARIPGLKLMRADGLDRTKLNIDMYLCGLDGAALEKYLMEKNIFIELVSGNFVMCMTGIGNVRSDYERLIAALRELSHSRSMTAPENPCRKKVLTYRLRWHAIPEHKELVLLNEAPGRVCASSIIPYPPGIPIACPGEVLEKEVTDYIEDLRKTGEKVIGVSEDLKVWVGK